MVYYVIYSQLKDRVIPQIISHRLFAFSCLQEYLYCVISRFNSNYFVFIVLFVVWFDSLRPINNFSVIKQQVFLGKTSTKLGLMFLLKDTMQ